jgi:CRISPR-associated protein Csb2
VISISLRFVAGRFHATPWRRHVNEGAVEWPPSPWRIVRALIAVWKRTLSEIPQAQVEPIFRALAEPPEFVLLAASIGHTRHFMPWYKKGPDDRTLVFDAFVAVCKATPLLVQWPLAVLDNDKVQLLDRIVRNLNSLGRAESWCTAEIVPDSATFSGFTCLPLERDPPENWETIRVLCADPAYAFSSNALVAHGRKRRSKAKAGAGPVNDPLWNLCVETLQFESQRWSDPLGSRWVRYARPRDCFKIVPRFQTKRATVSMQVARYALDSTVLPLLTDTLTIAEAARRALMGIYGRLTRTNGVGGRSRIFSGKDEQDKPLTTHRHCYYLPTDEDGDDRLDHLTVFAADGFGAQERRALDIMRQLRTSREAEAHHPLRLLLLGVGTADEYLPGPLRTANIWVSATPYLATRYAKTRGRSRIDLRSPEACADFLANDIRAQLDVVLPDIIGERAGSVSIEPIWDDNHMFKIKARWRTLDFKRFRQKRDDDGGRRLAGSFKLVFDKPVRGPISLGHSGHFGLGLFLPIVRD